MALIVPWGFVVLPAERECELAWVVPAPRALCSSFQPSWKAPILLKYHPFPAISSITWTPAFVLLLVRHGGCRLSRFNSAWLPVRSLLCDSFSFPHQYYPERFGWLLPTHHLCQWASHFILVICFWVSSHWNWLCVGGEGGEGSTPFCISQCLAQCQVCSSNFLSQWICTWGTFKIVFSLFEISLHVLSDSTCSCFTDEEWRLRSSEIVDMGCMGWNGDSDLRLQGLCLVGFFRDKADSYRFDESHMLLGIGQPRFLVSFWGWVWSHREQEEPSETLLWWPELAFSLGGVAVHFNLQTRKILDMGERILGPLQNWC